MKESPDHCYYEKYIYMVTVIWSQNRTKNESAKEKLCLDCIEATQETDILTEVVKENAALFTNFHSLIVKEVIQTKKLWWKWKNVS